MDISRLVSRIIQAEKRIRPHIRKTFVEPSFFLGGRSRAEVFLKLENHQLTGSFKIRGALNKLLSLREQSDSSRFVTASSGNHALAVVSAARLAGMEGTIFLARDVAPGKLKSLQDQGAQLRIVAGQCGDAERAARQEAQQSQVPYISPYNDPAIVAGQGTIGLELVDQLERLDSVFVAVGGGGLISGIAAYMKNRLPGLRVIGCQPLHSAVMARSVQAGHVVELESLPTLSDGTAGAVDLDSMTFPYCRELVDDYVLVSEAEIASAMRCLAREHRQVVEGAAAVAVAALIKSESDLIGSRSAVVLCGGNVGWETLKEVLYES